jgi:hypothetical protein
VIHRIGNVGQLGVNKDLSQHELPDNAWSDAQNVRFLDGYAYQFLGYGEAYPTPSEAPQYLLPVIVGGIKSWVYPTAAKTFVASISGGAVVHTNITHVTPRTGVVNAWTGTLLSGIPILNAGDSTSKPMAWDLNTVNKFVDLTNWPANTYCKAIRAYKNFLFALNITKTTTNYGYMVKWSHPADPGSLPPSWDHTDSTRLAGEVDIAEGGDVVVDGLQLRDSFVVYKENSTWRFDFTGGQSVFRMSKVIGTDGIMNRNCAVEFNGFHLVLTGSDVMLHDGQSASSVLDKTTRRWLFQNIDESARNLCFVAKHPFFNEILICYPAIGSTVCDKAMVYNYVDKTVSFRDMPNVNHVSSGAIDTTLASSWASDSDPWLSDLTAWNGPGFVPAISSCVAASADIKLYALDTTAYLNGVAPVAYLERRGLSFGSPETIKLVRGVRPRIFGDTDNTVLIRIGSQDDPWEEPTWGEQLTHTIGSTIANDCLVTGRYIAIRIDSGTAVIWRLDSLDLDIQPAGAW